MTQTSQIVLVVDDDDAVRRLAAAIVRKLGYETMEARNGLEALQVYGSYRSDIALIVTDVQMPVMDGLELIHRVRGMHAGVRVVVISGCAAGLPALPAGCCLLAKPFTPAQLGDFVRRAIARDPEE